MDDTTDSRYILFYDGYCNLCNFWVRVVLRHLSREKIYFSSLQSNFAKEFLASYELPEPSEKSETMYFYSDGKLLDKSTAVLQVCRHLGRFHQYLYPLIIIPAPIRDFIYMLVSKSRYSIFGKREDVCDYRAIEKYDNELFLE